MFLSALAKYLDIKAEAGERDDHFAYAAASLAHYGRWMAEHELPYFDQVEKLEFPTETWAAQDLRKANVLRLAAKYCDASDRMRLLQRGTELADRAWSDLAGFETRFVARSLALVLTEGARDCWLRNQAFDQCTSTPKVEPPARTQFVGQRDRVKQKLKSPGGLLSCLINASNPVRWPRFVKALMRQF